MACNCTNYACLAVQRDFADCPTTLTLVLASPITGSLEWEFEFNSVWRGGTIDVTEGENIVLPWVFNEQYIHLIKFYNGDTLLNDTCYKLDTSKISGSYTSPGSSTETTNYLTFTVTAGMLSDSGATITNASIGGRTILLIADGFQIYNSGRFAQVSGSDTFTMSAPVKFKAGQVITLLFTTN